MTKKKVEDVDEEFDENVGEIFDMGEEDDVEGGGDVEVSEGFLSEDDGGEMERGNLEGLFEISDEGVGEAAIGELGLATSREGSPRVRKGLELSVGEEKWVGEDVEEEDFENRGYVVGSGERREEVYGVVSDGSDNVSGSYGSSLGGVYDAVNGVYSPSIDSGVRGVYNAEKKFGDITEDKGEKKFWGETRLPGMSRLEQTRLEKIGRVVPEELGRKKKNPWS